jgi:hypothetical protein
MSDIAIKIWAKSDLGAIEEFDLGNNSFELAELLLKGHFFGFNFKLSEILGQDFHNFVQVFYHKMSVSVSEGYEPYIEPTFQDPKVLTPIFFKIRKSLQKNLKAFAEKNEHNSDASGIKIGFGRNHFFLGLLSGKCKSKSTVLFCIGGMSNAQGDYPQLACDKDFDADKFRHIVRCIEDVSKFQGILEVLEKQNKTIALVCQDY